MVYRLVRTHRPLQPHICVHSFFLRAKASLIGINKGDAPSFSRQLEGQTTVYSCCKNGQLIVSALELTSVWQMLVKFSASKISW